MTYLKRAIFDFRALLLLVVLPLTACGAEQGAEPKDSLVWVFCQFNVPEENDQIGTYWYFGSMSKILYEKITNNELDRGFMKLTDVHFWNDDVIEYYEDAHYAGTLSFRIEHVVEIVEMTGPFEVGFSYDDTPEAESDSNSNEAAEQ